MLCQSDLILLHKWGLDDSQSHTTVTIRTNRFHFMNISNSSVIFKNIKLNNPTDHNRQIVTNCIGQKNILLNGSTCSFYDKKICCACHKFLFKRDPLFVCVST